MAKPNRARIQADKSLNGSASTFASKSRKSLPVFMVLKRRYD